MQTLEQWKDCVCRNVRLKSPDDAAPIAQACMDNGGDDGHTCVWHEAARFYGFLERCPCYPCASARKDSAIGRDKVMAAHNQGFRRDRTMGAHYNG